MLRPQSLQQDIAVHFFQFVSFGPKEALAIFSKNLIHFISCVSLISITRNSTRSTNNNADTAYLCLIPLPICDSFEIHPLFSHKMWFYYIEFASIE